jgi:hypothetical protein
LICFVGWPSATPSRPPRPELRVRGGRHWKAHPGLIALGLGGVGRGQLGLACEDRLVEGEFGLEQGRTILRSTRGMPFMLEETRDVSCALEAQRLGKGLNGIYWYDRVVEAVG